MCSSDVPARSWHQTGFSDAGVIDWSALPADLIQSIAKRLELNLDYLHFRAVCVPWRSATSSRPCHLPLQSPWLMASFDDDSDTYDFLCLSTNKTYKLQVPEARGKRCCGSSNGWIILLDDNQGASLVNPLTRAHIPLPPITAFPTVLDLWLEEEDEGDVNWEAVYDSKNLHDSILEKIVLSSSPNSDDAIALALVSERMAFCRIGDATWTIIDDWRGFFTDAIYHDGKFYVVDCMGAVFTLEIGSSPRVTLLVPPLSGDPIQRYVTESGGKILMVSRIRHVCDPARHACGPTVAFEVFLLDLNPAQTEWSKVHSLGGYSMFLGVNHSFSFSPDDYPGYQGDCIYFTDDFCWKYRGDAEDDDDDCRHNDLGIFNLLSERMRSVPLSLDRCRFFWPTPKWITPSLC